MAPATSNEPRRHVQSAKALRVKGPRSRNHDARIIALCQASTQEYPANVDVVGDIAALETADGAVEITC
jgi:hypothetical protein